MIYIANPHVLMIALAIIPFILIVKLIQRRLEGSVRFSSGNLVKGLRGTLRLKISGNFVFLRAIILVLIIFALSRPQSVTEKTNIHVEGVDIVLTVDVSSSMRAMDFEIFGRRVSRLEVVKRAVEDFINKRPNDRIGLVAFSAYAYTVCPITLDHEWLLKNLERVQIGMIEDGTAIGSAITSSLNRLKDTETKEKIIILLTDGRNNSGRIPPEVAAEAANAMGIKIYTIGAGTKGLAPYPMKDRYGNNVLRPVEIQIDENLLEGIAARTGGLYFRATDTESLENIYSEIDLLEKTKIEEVGYNIHKELFAFFLIPAFGLLLIELFLSNTLFRRIP